MKKILNKFAIMATFAIFGATLTASAVGLNGSFESGSTPGGFTTVFSGNSATITDWTVTAGSVDYIGTYWTASEGVRSLDMSGNSAGAISQTFPTVVGTNYKVSFDMSGNPECGLALKSMNVSATGATTANYTYDTAAEANTFANMKWKTKTYSFVATSVSTTLTFTSQTVSACGPTLDNVVISTPVTTSTVVVRLADLDAGPTATAATNNSGKWFMYNDNPDTIDNTLGSFVTGPATPTYGVGSIGFTLGANPLDRKNRANTK